MILCAQQANVPVNDNTIAFGMILVAASVELVPVLLAIDKEFTDSFVIITNKPGLKEALLNFELNSPFTHRDRSHSEHQTDNSPLSYLYESHSDYETPKQN